MKKHSYLFIAFLALFAAAGCAPGNEVGEVDDYGRETRELGQREAEEPGILRDGPFEWEAEATMRGELARVDIDAMTFTLITDEGLEEEFEYSEETRIVGAAGAQGLAGREGTRVTVRYDESFLGTANAVHIEFEMAGPGSTP